MTRKTKRDLEREIDGLGGGEKSAEEWALEHIENDTVDMTFKIGEYTPKEDRDGVCFAIAPPWEYDTSREKIPTWLDEEELPVKL